MECELKNRVLIVSKLNLRNQIGKMPDTAGTRLEGLGKRVCAEEGLYEICPCKGTQL